MKKKPFQLGFMDDDIMKKFRIIKEKLNNSNLGRVTNEQTMIYLLELGNEKLSNNDDNEELFS